MPAYLNDPSAERILTFEVDSNGRGLSTRPTSVRFSIEFSLECRVITSGSRESPLNMDPATVYRPLGSRSTPRTSSHGSDITSMPCDFPFLELKSRKRDAATGSSLLASGRTDLRFDFLDGFSEKAFFRRRRGMRNLRFRRPYAEPFESYIDTGLFRRFPKNFLHVERATVGIIVRIEVPWVSQYTEDAKRDIVKL